MDDFEALQERTNFLREVLAKFDIDLKITVIKLSSFDDQLQTLSSAMRSIQGLVLINGKVEPLRAYKKIIGFVPQDDTVHGNLTVDENHWFSARCRLSADMSKVEDVLVVERVIKSLGLQAVHNSLVGIVEKRGISGCQRKRVNVGLEMVMEPSLLILDEPSLLMEPTLLSGLLY